MKKNVICIQERIWEYFRIKCNYIVDVLDEKKGSENRTLWYSRQDRAWTWQALTDSDRLSAPVRYERNQWQSWSGRLIEKIWFRRVWWQTESKAFLKSRKMPQIGVEQSKWEWIEWITEIKASIVEREGIKPNWLDEIRELSRKWSRSIFATYFSSSFETIGNNDMGL